MNELMKILIERDGYSISDATAEIESMRDRVVNDGENPDEILYEYGLEPDYVFDLLY
jgi:hypothetical protein